MHHFIEGGRVGDDGGGVVGEDCGDDDGHGSVPEPPEEKGRSLPLAPGGAGTPPGAIIITAIYTNASAIFTNISITFPHLYSAVHSPATHCTLYLNMVLYASYYYPMMCCHPMMSE